MYFSCKHCEREIDPRSPCNCPGAIREPLEERLRRATYMLEEAFRCIRRHTGLRGWDQVIASRIDAGLQSKTCDECGGHGYIPNLSKWRGEDEDDLPCTACGRQGYILVPLDPIDLVRLP